MPSGWQCVVIAESVACSTTSGPCKSSCTSDGDCVSTAYCSDQDGGAAGTCISREAAGLGCAFNDECTSQNCQSNCCNSSIREEGISQGVIIDMLRYRLHVRRKIPQRSDRMSNLVKKLRLTR